MIAVDHFAGCGWGVALQQRGVKEYGAENAPAALETRRINGMETYVEDVWDALDWPQMTPKHDLYLASPPCQTFSHAGAGAGRKALDQVLEAVDCQLYRWPEELQTFGEETDPRTALVLAPLAHIWQHAPRLVALEQVEAVLPVWGAYAEVMRTMGYSVWTGYLFAEQYGVAQTRKRAFLIARRDGIEARPPVPTHSRFYARDPQRLDTGVLPWTTMAEAIGWGLTARPAPTQTGHGGATRQASGQQSIYRDAISTGKFKFRPPFTAEDARRSDDPISLSRAFYPAAINMNHDEVATIQTYPAGFEFAGTVAQRDLQIGNAVPPLLAGAIIDELMRTEDS